ncbi:hypothetical protein Despr_0885 [Candidatus Vecturithrix granuli]|uniref:Uncharacterized protein n=1 Tax=Vecturithrix granuli TaxID=1499967 RepID=A0A081C6L7_VECG1|nr:hypothetical protein Despr_0885 [Candidatus Vecturithrix granuli]
MQNTMICPFCQQPKGNPRCGFCHNETQKPSPDGKDISHPSLHDIDIHHTSALTEPQQYAPLIQWFQHKHIQVKVNQKALDTTGFFDEVAMKLGEHYAILHEVTDKITHIQKKGYLNVKLILSKKSQQEIQSITAFCQKLYDYSFVAKYYYQKKEKIVHLLLQTATVIVNFFNGEWMEWFVFMKLLEFCQERRLEYSCLRNFLITFPNGDSHEVDVFFLLKGQIPLFIECKSGEFRQDIDKYATLRKRLQIEKTHFLLCTVGLTQKQSQGLTSMYDLTFVNEQNFLGHVEQLL